MNNTDKVKALREKVPVGIGQAKKLLTENDVDIIKAEQSFKKNMISLFMSEYLLNEEQATKYLEKAQYDLGNARKNFEEKKYSVTELCLKKYKDKEETLLKILLSIEQKYNYDFWLCWQKEDIPQLNDSMKTFVTLLEWIFYVSWESELVINKEIASQWEKLHIEWLTSFFDKALRQKEKLEGTDKKIWEDSVYKLFHDTFRKRKQELIDKLYEFMKEHLAEFP